MASFTGHLADDPYVSEQQRGHIGRIVDNPFKRFNAWTVSTDNPYSGSAALKLFPGGIYTLDVAVDAGSRTLRLQAWAPTGGAVRIDLLDPDTGDTIETDSTESEEEYEQLSVNWTAEARVYLLVVRHMGSTQMVEETDACAHIDAIEVL
jgi:glucan phosphorylase